MMKTRISFTGELTISELVKISMSDNYHVVKSDGDIQMCSHQGHKFLEDGTYIAVHAFRMREQEKSGEVQRFNTGLIDVRIDKDPEDKGISLYITLNY